MRQLLYVSDSLIGNDPQALDALMIQARTNNAIDGVTGMLWTDGRRFAQVLEGGDDAIAVMLVKLPRDPRHTNFQVVEDREVEAREFGEWSMTRPADDIMTGVYEQRMMRQLARSDGPPAAAFAQIISESRAPG